MKNFHIRCIGDRELAIPFQWAEQEGWQPGLDDASHYYSVDPQGFFMGFLNNEPMGCISGVAMMTVMDLLVYILSGLNFVIKALAWLYGIELCNIYKEETLV